MVKTSVVGKGKLGRKVTLSKTKSRPPEYEIVTEWSDGKIIPAGTFTATETYTANLIDKHHVLVSSQSALERPLIHILGVAHTMREADDKLAKLAESEFNRKLYETKHPTPAQVRFYEKYPQITKIMYINNLR